MSSDERPVFPKERVDKYFDRLGITGDRIYSVKDLSPEKALEYLAFLQKHHLVAVPFENLTLHYSPHRQISLHPDAVYQKIVGDNNGRGGYCMENNLLFGILLHSLGFNLYPAGARVCDGGRWTGWSHMVNIVVIGEERYHVDVGFGTNCPIQPLKLDSSGLVYQHIHPGTMRLQWRNIDANTNPNQRLWVYEHKKDEQSEFQQTYCFTELEFLPSDYSLMSYFTSTNPRTFFTYRVMCERKLFDVDHQIAGNVVLTDKFKWRRKGDENIDHNLTDEEDRTTHLEKYFGIRFTSIERDSIRGLVSELKSA